MNAWHTENFRAGVCGMGLVHSMGGLAELESLQPIQTNALSRPFLQTAAKDLQARLHSLLPQANLRRVPHYARMATLAALEALSAAKVSSAARKNTALILGTAYGCCETSLDFMDSVLTQGPALASPTSFSHSVTNVAQGLVSALLGLEGIAFTVTTFSLSFANALMAGIALLASGRAEHVLVGAVDEAERRFLTICPSQTKPPLPQTEGAAFLCLGQGDMLPSLSVHSARSLEKGDLLFASGDFTESGTNHEALFGHSPLTQALDTLLALSLIRQGKAKTIHCVCEQRRPTAHDTQEDRRLRAWITVRSAL